MQRRCSRSHANERSSNRVPHRSTAGERGASSKTQHHPVEEWGGAFSRARIGDWCSSSSVPSNEFPRVVVVVVVVVALSSSRERAKEPLPFSDVTRFRRLHPFLPFLKRACSFNLTLREATWVKEVETSKTRRFARTKRTKRARFRPTNERRANARANDSTKETDERTKKTGRGIFF